MRLPPTRAKVNAGTCAAARRIRGEDEDLARKSTGKQRNPKPEQDPTATPAPEDALATATDAPEPSEPATDTPATDPAPDAPEPAADSPAQTGDDIPDAEVVSETPPPPRDGTDGDAVTDTPEAAPEAETAEQKDPEAAAPENAEGLGPEAPTATPDPAPHAPAPKGSILPMLLGGAIAAGLGYGAHMLTVAPPPAAPQVDTSALEGQIAELRGALDALSIPPAFDPAPLQDDIAALRAELAAQPAAPTIDPAALDALSARLDTLDTNAAALQQTMAAQLAALSAELAEVRDIAQTRVVEAEAAVDAALAQAGFDSLRAALETGAPFAQAVTQITQAGIPVPPELTAIAGTGIATPEALAEGFGDAARAALRASLTEAPAASTTERLGNFLRAQVGARSTTPRDGDDADAVLSRAGAAIDAGDLDGALAELAALPEAGQAGR